MRKIGGRGSGKGQFSFGYSGLCISPDGDSVLVAEDLNSRVQEVRVDGPTAACPWVRFVGERMLTRPRFVDCNVNVIVVSEDRNSVSVLSWQTGELLYCYNIMLSLQLSRIPDYATERRFLMCVARLSGDNMVLADWSRNELSVVSLSGLSVAKVGETTLHSPLDMTVRHDGFFVADCHGLRVVEMSSDGVLGACRMFANGDTLASLPDGGLIVLDRSPRAVFAQFHVFFGLDLRALWVSLCVMHIGPRSRRFPAA